MKQLVNFEDVIGLKSGQPFKKTDTGLAVLPQKYQEFCVFLCGNTHSPTHT